MKISAHHERRRPAPDPYQIYPMHLKPGDVIRRRGKDNQTFERVVLKVKKYLGPLRASYPRGAMYVQYRDPIASDRKAVVEGWVTLPNDKLVRVLRYASETPDVDPFS